MKMETIHYLLENICTTLPLPKWSIILNSYQIDPDVRRTTAIQVNESNFSLETTNPSLQSIKMSYYERGYPSSSGRSRRDSSAYSSYSHSYSTTAPRDYGSDYGYGSSQAYASTKPRSSYRSSQYDSAKYSSRYESESSSDDEPIYVTREPKRASYTSHRSDYRSAYPTSYSTSTARPTRSRTTRDSGYPTESSSRRHHSPYRSSRYDDDDYSAPPLSTGHFADSSRSRGYDDYSPPPRARRSTQTSYDDYERSKPKKSDYSYSFADTEAGRDYYGSSSRSRREESSRYDDSYSRKESRSGKSTKDRYYDDYEDTPRASKREGKSRRESTLRTVDEEIPDHYRTLGLSSEASMDEIKSAARKMRVATHPDKLKKPGMSESQLKQIDERAAKVGEAAQILSDPKSKKAYDRERR